MAWRVELIRPEDDAMARWRSEAAQQHTFEFTSPSGLKMWVALPFELAKSLPAVRHWAKGIAKACRRIEPNLPT